MSYLYMALGIILGMIIEGLIRNSRDKLPTPKDIAKAILDEAVDPNAINIINPSTPLVIRNKDNEEIIKSPHDHPIYGHVPYKIVEGSKIVYEGYDSNAAYFTWVSLENANERESCDYFIGNNLQATLAARG